MYATIWGFWKHPEKIWELLHDFMRSSDPTPNAAHVALADLQKMGYLKSIVTQNVDNLHQDAGSTNVIEYHGSLLSVGFLARLARFPGCRVAWRQKTDNKFSQSFPESDPALRGVYLYISLPRLLHTYMYVCSSIDKVC